MITRRRAIRAVFVSICFLSSLLISRQSLAADQAAAHAEDVISGLAADIWRSRDQISETAGRRQRLFQVIEAKTSVDLLSRLVLGRHWRSLEAVDHEEYRALFTKVVIGGLASRLDTLLHEIEGPLEQHFSITGSGVVGKKDVLVRSVVIAADGQSLSVDWRLRKLENAPVVIDLVVEGISLLVSQRAEFAAVIERDQIDGLMETLRRRARTDSS